jgi:hypothetical protein
MQMGRLFFISYILLLTKNSINFLNFLADYFLIFTVFVDFFDFFSIVLFEPYIKI